MSQNPSTAAFQWLNAALDKLDTNSLTSIHEFISEIAANSGRKLEGVSAEELKKCVVPDAGWEEYPSVADREADEADFFERHPKCRGFAEIFHYLRGLEISEDVAADVAKSLLWAESRASKAMGTGGAGKFQPKITDEEFLSLFSEKAGASFAGLQEEAVRQFQISRSTFMRKLRTAADTGDIFKTDSGLWRRASK